MAKKKWIDELQGYVGRFISLETGSGGVREGRLTGLRAQTIEFNGREVDYATELELNGDPFDVVPITSLVKLKIEPKS